MKIIIKNLDKSFKNNKVLDDINIEFESGKIYGLFGPNGCGKTVLLKLLCGFYVPDRGNILYDNLDIFNEDMYAPNTRALIETPSFIGEYTAFENLKILAKIQNIINDNDILNCMEELGLSSIKNKRVSTLSLGYKQRLGIAQVLMENPEVMIFDEPFNTMDEDSFEDLKRILLKRKKSGKIIIISSHLKEELFDLSDVVYKFKNGRITVYDKK